MDGIATAKGSFDLTGASTSQIGWSGVGQYNDLVNPCAMMVWMGAIAQPGGKTAVPYLISKTRGGPSPSFPAPLYQERPISSSMLTRLRWWAI